MARYIPRFSRLSLMALTLGVTLGVTLVVTLLALPQHAYAAPRPHSPQNVMIKKQTASDGNAPLLGAYFFDVSSIKQNRADGSVFTNYDYTQSFFGWWDASDGDLGDTVPNTSQIVDEEIDSAANAGIDFFAFDWYGNDAAYGLDQPYQTYLNSAKKGRIKYALNPITSFLFTNEGGTSKWESTWVPYFIQQFADPQYVKLPGNRPLVFLWNPNDMVNYFGSTTAGKAEVDYLRNQTIAAGYGNPYIVDPTNAQSNGAALGYDAESDYGPSDLQASYHVPYKTRADYINSVNSGTLSGQDRVYEIMAAPDGRAVQCAGEGAGWGDLPTYSQWETNFNNIWTTLKNGPTNTANTPIGIIYAWGEVVEGGPAIIPSVQQGNTYLDAIQAVKSGNLPSQYIDTVNDSYLYNGDNTGINFSTNDWTYNGPPYSNCNNSGNDHATDANGDQLWGFNGNDETTTSNTGATANLSYDLSNGFRLIAAKGPNRGQIDITIDNTDFGTYDLYAPTLQRQQIIFDTMGALTTDPHTLKITVLSTRNSASSGNLVGIDAIQIQRGRTRSDDPVFLPPPPQVVVAQGYQNRVEVSFNTVRGANSYQILRSTTNNGPYDVVGTYTPTNVQNQQQTYTDSSLTNGTTYYYVVKAVTGYGTTAASSQTSAIPSVNLALGGTYSAATNASSAGNAFDNNLSTSWQGDAGTPFSQQTLEADFANGASQGFNRVKIWEEGQLTQGFRIEYWDGTTWNLAYTGTTIGDAAHPREITFQEVYGSKVRLVFTAGSGAPQIDEFEVYQR